MVLEYSSIAKITKSPFERAKIVPVQFLIRKAPQIHRHHEISSVRKSVIKIEARQIIFPLPEGHIYFHPTAGTDF